MATFSHNELLDPDDPRIVRRERRPRPRWQLLLVLWAVLAIAFAVWITGQVGLKETAEYVCLGSEFECRSLGSPYLGLFTAMYWAGLVVMLLAIVALLLERVDARASRRG
jgi:hypothetical protein